MSRLQRIIINEIAIRGPLTLKELSFAIFLEVTVPRCVALRTALKNFRLVFSDTEGYPKKYKVRVPARVN